MSDAHHTLEVLEWQQSLRDVLALSGPEQAKTILTALQAEAHKAGIAFEHPLNTPYLNTIPVEKQVPFPGSREIERRIKSIIRWNAMAMVTRANKKLDGIGGHISTYASAATLLEIGFNHFWRAASDKHPGDLVFFQGHSSPGIYARAFVEGRLSEAQLNNFRRELAPGGGLSSYPHPWLMKDFWKFPTVSMGLGPLMAIYQARFIKYLENRGLKPKSDQKVWCFIGDGEFDEPETTGCISIAGREQLDNLVFVLNCNLQRLDGPVRGNGSIVREAEARFRSANWNVIKCLWGSEWDTLLARDTSGALVKQFENTVDGMYQKLSISNGAYVREHFFGGNDALKKLVANMADSELKKLKRGGHDPAKVYNAYKSATETVGRPTIIIAKTVKGYGLGEAGEGKNIAHNQKKLNEDELLSFRTRFGIPISDEEVAKAPFYRPPEKSVEMEYLRERRAALGGHVPARNSITVPIELPKADVFTEFNEGTGDREASTTMVVGRIVSKLLKDKGVGELIVPIIPDESRTFGMESLFSQCGIYAPTGQLYTPVDRDQLMYYKEAKNGQLLQEGINEAGATSSWVAAGTSYSVHKLNMIPFYVFYSMFGFQRVADLIWAAADSRCKGFLIGGTAGRTTLNGEGLQHEDGHSHVYASTVPNCKAYDPAYAYEMAVIIEEGIREMYHEGKDVFYYITAMNENYRMPPMPKGDTVREGILRGCYKFSAPAKGKAKANLLGSGTILNEVVKASGILAEKYKVQTNVYSVTSYKTLTDDALECDRWNLLHPGEAAKKPYVQTLFEGEPDVFVTSSDYMKCLSDTLARWVPGSLQSLGTNGFGRSESRANLRDFFEVDHKYVVLATLTLLVKKGELKADILPQAIKDLGIDSEKLNPLQA
jgi:pyruvate dehydrogenase E1 component